MYLLSLALVFTFLSTASQVFTAPVPYKSIDTRSEGATLIPRDELSLLERDFSYEPLDTRSFDDAEFDERSLDFFDPVDFEERSLDIDDPYEFEKRFLVERAPLPEPGLESYEQMQKRGFFKKMFRKVKHAVKKVSRKVKKVAHKVKHAWGKVKHVVKAAVRVAGAFVPGVAQAHRIANTVGRVAKTFHRHTKNHRKHH